MTPFGWITLLVCAAAGAAACLPQHQRLAHRLARCAVAMLLVSFGLLAAGGAFADLAAVEARHWLRAGAAVGGSLAFGLLLLWAVCRRQNNKNR